MSRSIYFNRIGKPFLNKFCHKTWLPCQQLYYEEITATNWGIHRKWSWPHEWNIYILSQRGLQMPWAKTLEYLCMPLAQCRAQRVYDSTICCNKNITWNFSCILLINLTFGSVFNCHIIINCYIPQHVFMKIWDF